jgi:hypothetical protein
MGMQSGAGKDPVMLLGDFESAIISSRAGSAADGQNAFKACFAGAGKHFRAVRIKFVALDMGMGVNVHG